MGKLRVHELAKKMGLQSRDLIEKLQAAGVSVKTASSSVEESEAMKALGAKPAAEQAAPKKPRTMLRRRRRGGGDDEQEQSAADDEAPAETPVAAEPPAPAPEPAKEAAPEPAAETPAEIAKAPEEAPPAAEAKPEAVEAKDEKAAEAPPAPQAEAKAEAPAEDSAEKAAEGEAKDASADAEKPKSASGDDEEDEENRPSNVMRVIDPNVIKDRLRAEGRDEKHFRPRQIKTYNVYNDRSGGGPRMVEVTGGPGGNNNNSAPSSGGPRPGAGGKKGGGGGQQNYRERREMRNDRWFNPGRKRKSGKRGAGPVITQAAAHKRVVEISDMVTVADLAHQMAIKNGQVIQKLMGMGMMVTVNQSIDYETAAIVASEFGFEVKNVAVTEEDILERPEDSDKDLEARAPVVTVMGHVDHGKTSLLDYIRNANVTKGEAGGITQHIGAYSVETARGRVTFLDTPGHEAFTSMRMRGAQVTDVVILVVAADDGVMPQTVEAIKHSRAAGVPIVVAINKCDKPDAKPERVMQELTEHQLVPEDWGGENIMVQVSALKGDNIDKLLESVVLQAEVLELQANPTKRATGTVVEAQLDKGRGPVATVLIQSGTLRQGEHIVAGEFAGKVRAMYDSHGKKLTEAGPSTPVQVLGLGGVPGAGDVFDSVADDKTAKKVADHRAIQAREAERAKSNQTRLSDFLNAKKDDEETHELAVIIKGDVGGSVEAVSEALERASTRKVRVVIVDKGVGTITENDVNTATASGAIIIGFNVKPDNKAQAAARREQTDVRTFSVIYEILDSVRESMADLLAPKLEERHVGNAEVRMTFSVPKLGVIAGSYVNDGKIVRGAKARIKRGKEVLHEGDIVSLKRFKDDVREVASGYECGIGVAGFKAFEEGDRIECVEYVEVRAELDEALVDIEEKEKKSAASASNSSAEAGAPA